jgi:hypothetical protein
MTSIAEWLIAGLAAPAQTDDGSTAKVECVSILVADLEFTLDPYGTIILDRNLCSCQCCFLP